MKNINSSNSAYAEVNKRFGLGEDVNTHKASDLNGKSITYSSDPSISSVPPELITVNSISELKNLMGQQAEADVTYPRPFPNDQKQVVENAKSKEDIIANTSLHVKSNIALAARAYVAGDHRRVIAYEDTINALMFPLKIAYFASLENLIISEEIVVDGPDPVVWNYDNITFEPGGYIKAYVDFAIHCNTMDKVK